METQKNGTNSEVYGMFDIRKIGFVRRASAWLLDAILLAVLTTGFMWVISLICHFDAAQELATEYHTAWEDFRKDYIPGVAEFYGFTYETNGEEYTVSIDGKNATLDDLLNALNKSKGEDAETAEAYETLLTLPPAEIVNAQYQYVYTMFFMMVSIGLLLAYMALEFVLPIFFKNGQTVGKKVFSICLVRPNCVRITTIALFARTLLGKYAIETMFPILLAFMFFFGGGGILMVILFAALLLLNVILFFVTKNRTPIHDIVAVTVAVDMKLQMIFASEEELTEKKAQLQKEFVKSSNS